MTDTPDRASIVAFLRKQPGSARFTASGANDLADMIERSDDLIPAKPKATIVDLLALHDLDLGALAHKVGVTGCGFTTVQADALRAHVSDYPMSDDFVRAVANQMPGAWLEDLRTLAALGAKVRAALSTSTIKVATPRVLQSADEAPCGSLIHPRWNNQPVTLHLPSARGWHLGQVAGHGVGSRPGWKWHEHGITGSVSLIAECLTEAECRHLSGLSAADALAWCEKREAARRG